jgi:hypothetical protein
MAVPCFTRLLLRFPIAAATDWALNAGMKNAPECNGAAVAMQRPRTRYGKVKLRSLSDLDGRTAAAREALALIERMQTALGGDLTAQEHQLVQRSAMLGVVTADFEARWVAGEQIPLSDTSLRAARRRVSS